MSTNLNQAQARAWMVWTFAATLAGALALLGFRGHNVPEGMVELGLIFAAYVMCMGVIARRAKDISTLLVFVWGGTMGMWCNRWFELCEKTVDSFLPQLGVFSPQVVDALDLPAAIAGAGIVSAALLLVATRSARVAWSCVGASLAAAAVPMMTDDPTHALPWAAFGWHAITAGSLAFWAVDEAVKGSQDRCHSCGTDVQGLTSPVCPRCAAPLAERARGAMLAIPPAVDRRPV